MLDQPFYSATLINKDQLDQLLPHSGAMSLLEGVTFWDQREIHCYATSHTLTTNPLRDHGQLASVNAIEYAAQAMAIHNTLLGLQKGIDSKPRIGFLATASKVKFFTQRLDIFSSPILLEAQNLTASEEGSLYQFNLSCESNTLVSGQAMVMLAPLSQE